MPLSLPPRGRTDSNHSDKNARYWSEYLLMHLDANTRSTKRGPSPATTMMLILMRAGENRARLHRISLLVTGRGYPPVTSLGLLSLRNSRPQWLSISISISLSFFVIGRGNKTGRRARRSWYRYRLMTT
jgi:hypothetical protein